MLVVSFLTVSHGRSMTSLSLLLSLPTNDSSFGQGTFMRTGAWSTTSFGRSRCFTTIARRPRTSCKQQQGLWASRLHRCSPCRASFNLSTCKYKWMQRNNHSSSHGKLDQHVTMRSPLHDELKTSCLLALPTACKLDPGNWARNQSSLRRSHTE